MKMCNERYTLRSNPATINLPFYLSGYVLHTKYYLVTRLRNPSKEKYFLTGGLACDKKRESKNAWCFRLCQAVWRLATVQLGLSFCSFSPTIEKKILMLLPAGLFFTWAGFLTCCANADTKFTITIQAC